MDRRRSGFSLGYLLPAVAAAGLLFGAAPRAGAQASQAYPERPVRLIVPFPAGGTVDTVARSLAQQLAGALKQAVVVENPTVGPFEPTLPLI